MSSGVGQRGGQTLAELDHRLVVEPRVRVEPAQLAVGGVGHPRVGVPEHGDVVDHVEVHPAGGRHQVVPPAAFDLRWVGVVVLLNARRSCCRGAPTDLGSRGVRQRGSPRSGRGRAPREPARRRDRRRSNGGAAGAPTGRTVHRGPARPRRCVANGAPASTRSPESRVGAGHRQHVIGSAEGDVSPFAADLARPRCGKRERAAGHSEMPVATTSGECSLEEGAPGQIAARRSG